jgi:hypothetical protein
MKLEEMQQQLTELRARVQALEDTEAIKKLQRAYGYYLQHFMADDLSDLFADGPESCLIIAAGTFKGKEAVRRFFHMGQEGDMKRLPNPEFLHQVMQLSGVVHVAPDGLTAQGRWYGFGANAFPTKEGKVNPGWMDGIYEVDYVKQEGIWKLRKVRWCMMFHAPWTLSFVPPERREDKMMNRPEKTSAPLRPTGGPEETQWPSGFICPFHFANPVSGRKTY